MSTETPRTSAVTRGLDASVARERLLVEGPNELRRAHATPVWRMFARQFRGAMILLLAAACVLSVAVGEMGDALAIAAIVLLNGFIGSLQEARAERAALALRAMTAPRARVVRDGRAAVIPAAEVVRGDVLLLEAGDVVAADARVLEGHALSANEAALTGESMPVAKQPGGNDTGAITERTGVVFAGTSIATGTGAAEVTATGMRTELGTIADLLANAGESATPLQARLEQVGRLLIALCLGIVAVVALLGLLRGDGWLQVLMSSVSLAVAAVPEGLAAVVTIALAVGVQRMAARHVLVRRLPSVETLGCATVVCTDKTGTLTTGIMRVREIWGEDPRSVVFAAAACCDAELNAEGLDGTGDPTEIAILAAARERGVERGDIERETPRTLVHPFDPERKMMSIRRADGVLYVKGGVDVLLPLCRTGTHGALETNADMAGRGLRVLGVAVGRGDSEDDLTLLGLLGIADPPRIEAVHAVAQARAAGIRTVMITGDHPVTAAAIARELGIVMPGETAVDRVHARATPADKLRIVRRWKERGEVVAMTGDGVNDAPALKEAHIGIAMGKTGTEVTREASDMILADDNFASIIAAVREGRGIYSNIQKTLVYLLSGNASELLLMLGASLAGLPLPLVPLQLLWINLVTDSLPAVALVMDPSSEDLLEVPPRPPNERILGRSQWRTIVAVASVEATVVLGVVAWTLAGAGLDKARSATKIFWQTGVFDNVKLLGVISLSVALQIGIHLLPSAQRFFDVQPLSPAEWGVVLALALVPVTCVEVAKLARRRRR